jgi:hypothetical protein
MQEFDARAEGLARHHDERLYVSGVQAGRFHGIDNSVAAGACHANDIALDAGLRDHELEEGFHVSWLLLPGLFVCAAAFAVGAVVDCERVDSSRCQRSGHAVPGCACAVALMEENHTGTGLAGGEIGGFEQGAVGGFQIQDL